MCATDVLGIAPEAQIYDLRIAGPGGAPGSISRALQSFEWAINQHRRDGTPQILTNSWGIYQEAWDPVYARDPNHVFTRKVAEVIDEGIIVLFAAGNCGDSCPDDRCGSDIGIGRSIWGANGHPSVICVGAVNIREEFIGYSSRGPSALGAPKPDVCSVSHFKGYFPSDSGTSAATPVLAGIVALLKQAAPSATQSDIKHALERTAKNIGQDGFDVHSGWGLIDPERALQQL
jgi:subtilisin family serine protease